MTIAEQVRTCLTACRRMGLHEPADLIESLSAQVADYDRKWDEQISILESAGPITCRNGKQHPVHEGCLYCRAEKAEQDARRVDWMEENLTVIRDIGWVNSTTAMPLREAIDAAIDKPPPAGEEPSSQK